MKALIDTSSLFKKYVQEINSDKFEQLINKVTDVWVAPTTLLELYCTIKRRLDEKLLIPSEAEAIKSNIQRDFDYFTKILWDELLEDHCLNLSSKYGLKPLDLIQLSSGLISNPDIFVTSDQRLYKLARKELKKVILI